MKRMLLVLAGLLLIFYALAQLLPEGLLLPLYCTVSLVSMAYVWWERGQLSGRRARLERDLDRERLRGPGADLPWGEEE